MTEYHVGDSSKLLLIEGTAHQKPKPPISYSQTFAKVIARSTSKGKETEHYIESPGIFRMCTFCIVLLNYLTQTQTDDFDANYSKFRLVARVFMWLQDEFIGAQSLPADIVECYHTYLKRKKHAASSICQYIAQLRQAVQWAMQHMCLESEHYHLREELQKICSYIPSVPNIRSKTHLSLSQVTTGITRDERALVRSCMRFCGAFLKLMNKFRNSLRANKAVERQLQKLLSECEGDFSKLKWTASGGHYKRDYKHMAAAILASEDPALKEFLLCNQVNFIRNQCGFGDKLSILQADTYIKSGLTTRGGLLYTNTIWPTPLLFTNLDYLFLIKHTPAEEICFAWLLATDRIQQSGINNLLLSDIKILPSSVSVDYTKGRSGQFHHQTPLHPKTSIRYVAYSDYANVRSNFLRLFPDAGDMLFDVTAPGSLQVIESCFFQPLILASLPHTLLYDQMQDANEEVTSFAKILEQISIHNDCLRKKRVASKNREEIICDKTRQSVTVNIIAQSRAILDEDSRHSDVAGRSKSEEAFERYSEEVVGAAATAHSPGVKERYYIHASTTKYRLDKRAAFATAVGELMVADARKIKDLCQKNIFLTVEQIKESLGWGADAPNMSDIQEFDSLLDAHQKKGWSITPFGQLERDEVTIIIISPVEAALLISYRDECAKQLDEISTIENLRASALVMQIAYVDAILERFDKKTVSEGRDLLLNNVFPAPIIR